MNLRSEAIAWTSVALRSRMYAAALAALAFVVTASGAMAGEKLGKTHEDEVAGYSMRIPADWASVPIEPLEPLEVGLWQGTSRLGMDPRLEVRFWRIESTTETGDANPLGGGGKKPEEPEKPRDDLSSIERARLARIAAAPKNFRQWLERFSQSIGFKQEKESRARSKDGTTGVLIEGQAQGQLFYIASFSKDGREYGILYRADERDWKGAARVFQGSIRSFEILDSAGVTEDIKVRNWSGTKEEEQRRVKAREGLPADWYAYDTENYIFLSNADPKLVRDLAKRIETLRTDYFEKFFPPIGEITALSVVRVCKDRDTYLAYGAPPSSAGYWWSLTEELVFYQDRDNLRGSFETLHHEAFHQYIYYALGDVAPHTWFNEGNADYFAGSKFSGGRFRIVPRPDRASTMKGFIATGGTIPLAELINMSQAEYYAKGGWGYPHGWALVYYLREEAGGRNRRILPTYYETLKAALVNVRAGREPWIDENGKGTPPPSFVEKQAEKADEKEDGKVAVKIRRSAQQEGEERARQYALEMAFEGVDLDLLEKAWLKAS